MKKVILIILSVIFVLSISLVSYKFYSANNMDTDIQNAQQEENLKEQDKEKNNQKEKNKTETDTKIPIPEKIKQNKDFYKADLEKVINRILNDKITYRKNTLKELLDEYNAEADEIYQSYLSDEENYEKYYSRLNEITGTISMYSDAICEELQPVFKKYGVLIYPNTGCDSYVYEHYIKEFNIKNSNKLKELIDYHEASFDKIYKYEQEILK